MLITFDVNWVAIIISAIVSMVIGFIWYAEPVLGKTWMKELGLKKSDINPKPTIFIFSFLGALVASFILANILLAFSVDNLMDGVLVGALVGLVSFIAVKTTALFEYKSAVLIAIDGFYHLVWLAIAGGVITSF